MWSTRARLAAAYAGLLFVTLAAFCAAVYFARRASAYQELGQRAARAADQVLATMASVERAGTKLTVRDTIRDESGVKVIVGPQPALRNTLEPMPGYFLVLDQQSRLLYSSFAVRQLGAPDQEDLNAVALQLNPGGDAAIMPLPRDSV